MKTDPVITKTKFRLMLVFSIIFGIVSAMIDAWNETFLALEEYLLPLPQTWESVVVGTLGVFLIIVVIGLMLFQTWAKQLYVYSYLPLLLLYLSPSMSWLIMSGLASIFYELMLFLGALIWGILIMPSLYQPLFSKQNQDS